MNKNVLIALGGATLIALLVAMLMSALLGGGKKESESVAEAVPRVDIVVASSNIAAGQLLTDKNIKWKSWPADAVFPGVVVKKGSEKVTEALEGRLIRPIQMDEPVPDLKRASVLLPLRLVRRRWQVALSTPVIMLMSF